MSDSDNDHRLNDDPTPVADDAYNSLVRQIHDQIIDVIGGNDPNQFFSMTMPKAIIAKEDYEYDIRKEKCVRVEGNESRSVDKLFDPGHITNSDNGCILSNQFPSAVDTLTPNVSKDKKC